MYRSQSYAAKWRIILVLTLLRILFFFTESYYSKIIELFNNLKSDNNPPISKDLNDDLRDGFRQEYYIGKGNHGFTRCNRLFNKKIHIDDLSNALKNCEKEFKMPKPKIYQRIGQKK